MNEQKWEKVLRENLKSDEHYIPHTVHRRINETLANLPVQSKNKYFKIVSAIAACFILLIGLIFVIETPVAAKYFSKIPLIGSAFQRAGDPGIQNYKKYNDQTFINQIVEDQGITITLEQVIYDGTRLSIGLTHPIDVYLWFNGLQQNVKANGKVIHPTSSRYNETSVDTAVSVFNFMLNDELPDSFDLTITFDEVLINKEIVETLSGDWNFELIVNKIEEEKRQVIFDPPVIKSYEGTTISLKEVTLTPLTTKVSFELSESPLYSKTYSLMDLEARLESDQYVSNRLLFQLLDESGLHLRPISYGGSGVPDEPKQYHAYFAPMRINQGKFIFRAVHESNVFTKMDENLYMDNDKTLEYLEIPEVFPTTYSQGASGSITFYSIKRGEEFVQIEYEVIGENPHLQDQSWFLESSSGEKYTFSKNAHKTLLNDHSYRYSVRFFDIPYGEPLKIGITQHKRPEVIKELEFEIDISEH